MKTIFVIETGEYSDYRVVGVYSTRANAELVLARMKTGRWYNNAAIAEWPLDPNVKEISAGRKLWHVVMRRNGEVESIAPNELGDIDESRHIWKREEAPAYKGRGVPNVLEATVFARDEKHAIKIANEHRWKLLAANEWPATKLDIKLDAGSAP